MYHNPFLLVISSPSGAGKTSIAKKILNADKKLKLSVSYTTRKKRDYEKCGVDYHFVSDNIFQQMLKNNEFIESVAMYNKSYGSSKKKLNDMLEQGFDVLFDIDYEGTKKLVETYNQNIVTIFVLPPSIKELESRLNNRGTETKETLKSRVDEAKSEIGNWKYYDYVIINNKLEESVEAVTSIIASERIKRSRVKEFVSSLLDE